MPETTIVALIGDVHANLPALEAILADVQGRGIDTIWNIGDFVGYGAFPDQVVERLNQPGVTSIIGNYDLKVLKFPKKKKKWKKSKHPDKFLAFQWAYENLSKQSRDALRSLPEEVRLEVHGRRILLTHASPGSKTEHLTPETPEGRLRRLAKIARADVAIFGHSHRPFVREAGGVVFVNTGSVGRPEGGDPRACYGVLRIGPDGLEVEHVRLEYDVDRAAEAIRSHDLPESFAQMIIQGRNLDDVESTE